MTLAGLGPLFPVAVLHLSRSSRAVELSYGYPGTRRVLTRSVIPRPRSNPGHGRSCWAGTPDATGCCRFRPSSLEAAGPFPSPASLKAKRSPGPKVLQRESGTGSRLQLPAGCAPFRKRERTSRELRRTERGLQFPTGRAPRLCAQPLREDGRGTAWTTTPERSRAAPLRQAAERGLGGGAARPAC